MWRYLTLGLAALCLAVTAIAEEKINTFDVVIDVQQDGDIIVTENLNVTVEGIEIRRGIFRDFPRYFEGEGVRYEYDYDVLSVTRNGKREPYSRERIGNAIQVRIGDADVFLPRQDHQYEIRYRVKNQVRYFDDYDEVYWNATGTYWNFPIESASATLKFPSRVTVLQQQAYTGRYGNESQDYKYTQLSDSEYRFETTRRLARREGMTVALGFEKGVIDPPSAADERALWWQRYGALGILIASGIGVFSYYLRAFNKVGRDPPRQPVFPRYEPPEGYSPAATHHILNRGFSGHDALIATMMSLATKKWIKISVSGKKNTTLTKRTNEKELAQLTADEGMLMREAFSGRGKFTLGGSYDSKFTATYKTFRSHISKRYGRPYFRWNFGYALLGVPLTILAVIIVLMNTVNWTVWHSAGVLALAALNGLFLYLLPAPTKKGEQIRSEIAGFKLYMEKAEQLQLNTAEVGSETPPAMTTERYEKFLPYAVALGVEKPWTKHFEKLIPEEAKNYNPSWTNMGRGSFGTLSGMNDSLVKSVSSGVSTSSTPPSSSGSSGSSGGGFSGGGGGGGGGGGW